MTPTCVRTIVAGALTIVVAAECQSAARFPATQSVMPPDPAARPELVRQPYSCN